MAKSIFEMGYEATAVECGKFFDLDNVMTFEEMAHHYGYDNDEADNTAKKEAFTGAGYEFVGYVAVKEELEDVVVYSHKLMGGYLLKDKKDGRLYVAHDVWDVARYVGKVHAYRFNVFTRDSMYYDTAEEAYKDRVIGGTMAKKDKYTEADILALLNQDGCDFSGCCSECPVYGSPCRYTDERIYTGAFSVDDILKRLEDLTEAFTTIKNNLEV